MSSLERSIFEVILSDYIWPICVTLMILASTSVMLTASYWFFTLVVLNK